MVNYYQVLGISKKANQNEIKKAYHRLARDWHPDKHQESDKKELAEKKFKEIVEAYEVLKNEETKQIYDQHGYEGLKRHMQQAGPGDMPDIFSHLFPFARGGMGGMGSPFGRSQAPPKSHQAKVPLSAFYKGQTLSFQLKLQDKCSACRGSGCQDPSKVQKCSSCNGKGQVMQTRQIGPGFMARQVTTCPKCRGQGETYPSNAQCSACRGQKKIKVPAQVDFYIQPGSDYGSYLIRGKGDYLEGGQRGDIRLDLIPDETTSRYKRQGMKLFYEHTISLKEALLGFDHFIPHVDSEQQLHLVSTEVIQPGTVKVLAGKGMPHPKQKEVYGDLYLFFKIQFPTKIPANHRPVFETVLPGSTNKQHQSQSHPQPHSSKRETKDDLVLIDHLKTLKEGDQVEQPNDSSPEGPEAFFSGMDDHPGMPQNVQCAQQ